LLSGIDVSTIVDFVVTGTVLGAGMLASTNSAPASPKTTLVGKYLLSSAKTGEQLSLFLLAIVYTSSFVIVEVVLNGTKLFSIQSSLFTNPLKDDFA
jgi:hypothetical protein